MINFELFYNKYSYRFLFITLVFCFSHMEAQMFGGQIRPNSNNFCTTSVKVSSTTFKKFLCYNLGADTNLDPNSPNVGLIGAYIQFGKRGPNLTGNSLVDWKNASNDASGGFAAAPTATNDNSLAISGWNQSYNTATQWLDASGKTNLDPCPNGFRVPTNAEFDAMFNNNSIFRVGTWIKNSSNYTSALQFKPDGTTVAMTLPAGGFRQWDDGMLINMGFGGSYWSANSHVIEFGQYIYYTAPRTYTYGFSIRCIEN